jgi:malonyl CoA-acyl carrier protein transacylase
VKAATDSLMLLFSVTTKSIGEELKNTKNTHPAMFLSNVANYKMLMNVELRQLQEGHSLGEITALTRRNA